MRDFRLIMSTEEEPTWNLDIDIINGNPVYLPYSRNNQDQRAAIAMYMSKGTIPGMPDMGIDWAQLYQQDTTILNIDNEIKQNIQNLAGTPGTATQTYTPVYTKDDKGIHAIVYQAS